MHSFLRTARALRRAQSADGAVHSTSTPMRLIASSAIGEIAAAILPRRASAAMSASSKNKRLAMRPAQRRRDLARRAEGIIKAMVAAIGVDLQNAGIVAKMALGRLCAPVCWMGNRGRSQGGRWAVATQLYRGRKVIYKGRPSDGQVMMNVEDLYRLLRTGHVQAQGIVDTVADPMLVLDESLCVQSANRAFFETFRVDRYETIGQRLYELGNGQWDIPELRLLLAQVVPKATAVINYEVEHDFPSLGRRTMLVTARTLFHPDNGSHSMLLSIVDATERSRQDAAKDMLFGELRHRMKNLLGVAQSIARQTTTEGRSAEEYRDVFLGRFSALVEAQDLAFSEQDQTDLAALIERVLAPYTADPDAVLVEPGEVVELDPRTIMSLSLVLHELATNAAKHGALSESGGRVRVSWRVEEENSRLRLKWVESGGPPVTPPATTGYGTELIKSTTAYNLGGQVEQKYAAGGLEAEIVIPLRSASLPD